MKAVSMIAAVLAITGATAFASGAFAGNTTNPALCNAERATLQADGATGTSIQKYNVDKAGLEACLSQRQMDNGGTQEEQGHFRQGAISHK